MRLRNSVVGAPIGAAAPAAPKEPLVAAVPMQLGFELPGGKNPLMFLHEVGFSNFVVFWTAHILDCRVVRCS